MISPVRTGLLGVALAAALGASAQAAARTVERPGFALAYDDAVWTERPSAPPVALALTCAAADCPPDTQLTFVLDPRPLPRPGAGAFTPGAVSAALVDLRAQSLTPGGRLRAEAPAEPVGLGSVSGYRARYQVEDRALARSELLAVLVPFGDATLHVRLAASRITPRLEERFASVLAALRSGRPEPVPEDTGATPRDRENGKPLDLPGARQP